MTRIELISALDLAIIQASKTGSPLQGVKHGPKEGQITIKTKDGRVFTLQFV